MGLELIFGIGVASAVGTLLGNLGVFWTIGTMAQRQERKKIEQFQQMQKQMIEAVEKENERMRNYARMEG
jgi:hypothetical protein